MKPIIDFNDSGKAITRKFMKLVNNKHAFHKLGYLGRNDSKKTEYICVQYEKENYYIGNFVEGLGFVNVHFLKEDCQELAEEDIKYLDSYQTVIVPMSSVITVLNDEPHNLN